MGAPGQVLDVLKRHVLAEEIRDQQERNELAERICGRPAAASRSLTMWNTGISRSLSPFLLG